MMKQKTNGKSMQQKQRVTHEDKSQAVLCRKVFDEFVLAPRNFLSLSICFLEQCCTDASTKYCDIVQKLAEATYSHKKKNRFLKMGHFNRQCAPSYVSCHHQFPLTTEWGSCLAQTQPSPLAQTCHVSNAIFFNLPGTLREEGALKTIVR